MGGWVGGDCVAGACWRCACRLLCGGSFLVAGGGGCRSGFALPCSPSSLYPFHGRAAGWGGTPPCVPRSPAAAVRRWVGGGVNGGAGFRWRWVSAGLWPPPLRPLRAPPSPPSRGRARALPSPSTRSPFPFTHPPPRPPPFSILVGDIRRTRPRVTDRAPSSPLTGCHLRGCCARPVWLQCACLPLCSAPLPSARLVPGPLTPRRPSSFPSPFPVAVP